MSRFVFDTGIILGYVRDAGYCRYLDAKHQPLISPNLAVISAVSKGEILSLAIQFGWGQPKKDKLKALLDRLPAVEINRDSILDRYAEIDAFSQGKLTSNPLGTGARNMGKNDLWIAATASVLNAKLVTTDGDFDHLNKKYCDVIKIDQKLTEKDV
jgi:predicted nucleic acid-binding protein